MDYGGGGKFGGKGTGQEGSSCNSYQDWRISVCTQMISQTWIKRPPVQCGQSLIPAQTATKYKTLNVEATFPLWPDRFHFIARFDFIFKM